MGASDRKIVFYNHPLIKPNLIESREYQVNISQAATQKNTLVVLPTALGKTMIALFNAVEILQRAPGSKIFILAPTRPLVDQHFLNFQKFLQPTIKCCLFTSNLSPIKRTLALNEYQIFFSTPQIVQNDLKNGHYTLEGVGLLILDEAHKARFNYAYTYNAQMYIEQCKHPLIMGLTASPGKDLERINMLCEKLFIEQIIFRDAESPDVSKYTHTIDTIFTKVELPTEIIQAQAILETAQRKIQDFMIEKGVLPPKKYSSKMDFIRIMQDLKMLDFGTNGCEFNDNILWDRLNFPGVWEQIEGNALQQNDIHAIMFQAINGIYLAHLVEILTTQDVRMFRNYIGKLQERAQCGNKHVQRLLNARFLQETQKIVEKVGISPKIPTLQTILQNEFSGNSQAKIIIFTQFREMASYLVHALNNDQWCTGVKISAKRFVGQAGRVNDEGLSQTEQRQMIREFESGTFNVLVATSVAEEGLDIPNVDAVVFYEAIPSEIRLIQRRGRTGRHQTGRCYVLVSPSTLDEIYNIVSQKKEANMRTILQNPVMVSTIAPLPRTSTLPCHQKQTLEQIKHNFDVAKQNAELNKVQFIEQQVKDHPTQKIARGFQLVTDMTNILLEKSKIRVEIQHDRETERIQQAQKEKILVKKYYHWLRSTIEQFGTESTSEHGSCIACEIAQIQTIATEESQDWYKIQTEMEKAIKIGSLAKKGTKILLF